VRILFDSCSQKSYITTRLGKKLNLQAVGSETVSVQNQIKTFGNEQPSVKKCDVLQLAVECAENLKVYINAYEIDLADGFIELRQWRMALLSSDYLVNLRLLF
jgi:hypothetical protein